MYSAQWEHVISFQSRSAYLRKDVQKGRVPRCADLRESIAYPVIPDYEEIRN